MTFDQLKKWVVDTYWNRAEVAGWVERMFYRKAVHRQTSSGAVHAGLPVILDSTGNLDKTLIPAVLETLTTVGDGTGTAVLIIDGAAGQVRDLQYRSAGSLRWVVRTNSDAEAGSDAGSNFEIMSRTDAGAIKTTVVSINRASGIVTLAGGLAILNTPVEALTISSGAITPTRSYVSLNGQGAAADDLTTINGGAVGDHLYLRAATAAQPITVKHSATALALNGSVDYVMNNANDMLHLICIIAGTRWVEVGRGNNG